MKKWIYQLSTLFKTMGFSQEKIHAGLTAAEWQQVREAYETTFGTSLEQDKTLNEDVPAAEPEAITLTAEETAALAAALGVDQEEVPADPKAAAQMAAEMAAQRAQEAQEKAELAAHQAEEMARLAKKPETEQPLDTQRANKQTPINSMHSKTHLFGVEAEQYARSKWYNELMASPAHKLVNPTETDAETFNRDFKAQARQLRDRMAEHLVNGTFDSLDFNAIAAGTIDFTTGDSALDAMGYVTRRSDLVLAYFKQLPSVKDLFPVRSNVQNKEVAVSGIVGELSQGYRKGRIFKGSVEFDADIYKVDDLMFKFNFEDLVELEKQYIGYLNKDHSAIIKWTFIEWVMVHYGEELIREQNERNVIGVRVPQQDVVSNPANFAADGILTAVLRTVNQRRVLPFKEIGAYTAETMLDIVEEFADKVQEVAGSESNDMKIYLNARHKRWYIRAYREKYGKDADFTGAHATLVDLDPSVIVWVPNMRLNDFFIIAAEPGNIELLEDKPGEMLAFSWKEELEGVAVVSRWKEGAHVMKAGVKFDSLAELEADKFRHQFLFINWPVADTLGASSLVSASVDLKSSTPVLDTVYLTADTDTTVNLTDDETAEVKAGTVSVIYPKLTEQNGTLSATRWLAL